MNQFTQFTQVEPDREVGTRRGIAYGLLGMLGGALIFAGVTALLELSSFETVVAGLVTPVVGLVGSVVGFYFGSGE